jgi:hypothetical protein
MRTVKVLDSHIAYQDSGAGERTVLSAEPAWPGWWPTGCRRRSSTRRRNGRR